MAKSKYEYVKSFESKDSLLLDTYILVHLTCPQFEKFAKAHAFTRPFDARHEALMSQVLAWVMGQFTEIRLCYHFRDDITLLFPREAKLYNRRGDKILSYLTSAVTSTYVFLYPEHFAGSPELKFPLVWQGRVVLFARDAPVKDWLRWR